MSTGDPMSLSECKLLISRLQVTQQCFACAHGRPTMVPLADMNAVAKLLAGRRKPSARSAQGPSVSAQPAVLAKHSTAQLCGSLVRLQMREHQQVLE